MQQDQSAPRSLEQGWAAMAELYRGAWEQVFKTGAGPEQAMGLLGEALEQMRGMTEAAEAQVFGPATALWTAASRAEYADVAGRIDRVAARMASLEAALRAGPPPPEPSPAATPAAPPAAAEPAPTAPPVSAAVPATSAPRSAPKREKKAKDAGKKKRDAPKKGGR
jgi:hypothetical protein